jgi:hypothetical protein
MKWPIGSWLEAGNGTVGTRQGQGGGGGAGSTGGLPGEGQLPPA